MNVKSSISWHWTARDGTRKSVGFDVADLSPATIEQARQLARKAGYPGHRGGWWNYFVDDMAWILTGKSNSEGEPEPNANVKTP